MQPVRRSYNFFRTRTTPKRPGTRFNTWVGWKNVNKDPFSRDQLCAPGEEGFELAALGLQSEMSTNWPQSRTCCKMKLVKTFATSQLNEKKKKFKFLYLFINLCFVSRDLIYIHRTSVVVTFHCYVPLCLAMFCSVQLWNSCGMVNIKSASVFDGRSS